MAVRVGLVAGLAIGLFAAAAAFTDGRLQAVLLPAIAIAYLFGGLWLLIRMERKEPDEARRLPLDPSILREPSPRDRRRSRVAGGAALILITAAFVIGGDTSGPLAVLACVALLAWSWFMRGSLPPGGATGP